ncbi:MAG: type I-MYXAN CRISPR-associated protein Cas6/Cmx6, partial [Cyanobacteria bacterium J06635_10]
ELHNLDGWSLQTITGIADKQGIIYLGDRSYLRLRFAYERLSFFYPLAGKSLKIGKHTIRFGIPQIEILQPAKKLRSRLVVIKGYQEAESFLKAAQRQLDKLGINGTAIIPKNIDGEPKRKTIKIKRFTVVGFGLEVINLNNEDSLALQRYGIGGKHKMGCGVFVPVKEELS